MKTVRLVNYLTQIARLRSKLIRDWTKYEKVLWIADIPHERGCFTQAWGRDEEHEPDEWLEVQSRREPNPPTVPIQCDEWVNSEGIRNKDELPELLPAITRQVQNPDWHEESDQPETIPFTEHLDKHPEVQRAWDSYVKDEWKPWTEKHNVWENIDKAYSSLFAIHQAQLRLGEEYELVLGLGVLTWQTPTGQRVRRHLVVADALLEFEARLGKFTVRPHTDGTKLRPELDMLDVEEQPPHAEETAKSALTEAGDDPWEKNCVEDVFQALVHSINSQGDYDDSLEAKNIRVSEIPVVKYAPALILRKRSMKGLTETLKRIKEQIENGKDIPSEFANLAEIDVEDDREPGDEKEEGNVMFDGEVFFPKPSNDEQRHIVDKMRSSTGVLVQGPPGTGKSHTIANLICHLLATGQRIMVTAKTPRALQVLDKHIPAELRPLCINLLGSGPNERHSLESSVGGILRKNGEWDEDRARRDRMEMIDRLRTLREEQIKVNRQLRDIRESETHSQSLAEGAYQGTAARIAEAVNRDRTDYEWFTDSVSLDKTCPTSVSALRSILADIRQFTPEKRGELDLVWPEELSSVEHFGSLAENEIKAAERERVSETGADERVAEHLSTSEEGSIESLLSLLKTFRHECKQLLELQKPWIQEAIRDVSNGDASLWRELAATCNVECDLRSLLLALRQYTPTKLQELQLRFPDTLPSRERIQNIFDADKKATEEEELCLRDGADKHLANHLSANANIQTMHDSLSAFQSRQQQCLASNYSWMKDAVREITGDNVVAWSERCRVTKQTITSIEQFVSLADETTLDLPASGNVRVVLKDAVKLKKHMGMAVSWGGGCSGRKQLEIQFIYSRKCE